MSLTAVRWLTGATGSLAAAACVALGASSIAPQAHGDPQATTSPSAATQAAATPITTPAPIFTTPTADQPQPWSPDDGPLPAPDPAPLVAAPAPAQRNASPRPAPPARVAQADQPDPQPAHADLVDLVNADRAAAGCPPVTAHPDLQQQAERHAVAQAAADRMYHSDGVTGYDTWGENVAYGYDTAADVHQAWMDSPSHRDNVLDCSFTFIGIGAADSNTGVRYWTEQFAA